MILAILSSFKRHHRLFRSPVAIFAFAIMAILKKLADVAAEIMFTIEDYEVYGKIVRVRSFKRYA